MAENKIVANNGSSIVLYSTDDGNIQLEVKLEKGSVWLNREPVVAKFATPKKYGRKEGYTQMQKIDYYNLDMIISIGYRVKSRNGII